MQLCCFNVLFPLPNYLFGWLFIAKFISRQLTTRDNLVCRTKLIISVWRPCRKRCRRNSCDSGFGFCISCLPPAGLDCDVTRRGAPPSAQLVKVCGAGCYSYHTHFRLCLSWSCAFWVYFKLLVSFYLWIWFFGN